MLNMTLKNGEKVKVRSKQFKRVRLADQSFAYIEIAREQDFNATIKHTHQEKIWDWLETINNELDTASTRILSVAQGQLQNEVTNIDSRIVAAVIKKYQDSFKNAYDKQSDVINKKDKNDAIAALTVALAAFYNTLMPILGSANMAARLKEFGYNATFTVDKNVANFIKSISAKVADSHANTIINDLQTTMQNIYNGIVQKAASDAAKAAGRAVTDADLAYAREQALSGASQQQIVNGLQNKFNQISNTRAKAIARTETNRAFTQSQYQSDLQFLNENDLLANAYKQWTVQSADPCPFCLDLAAQDPVPFGDDFAELGDTLTATVTNPDGSTSVQSLLVNFEPLEAGNAHVNCSCIYVLIIQ